MIKKLSAALLVVSALIVFCWPVSSQQFPPLRVVESDGSPDVRGAYKLVFPNGSVSKSGGIATISFTGAGALTATNPTNHGVILGNGDQTLDVTAVGSTNTVLHGNTGADPTFSAVDLTADVTGVLPGANGGAANVSAADQGYLLTSTNMGIGTSVSAGIVVAANNAVRAFQFVLPFRLVVGKITFEVTTTVGSSLVDVGIYDAAGTTKLVSTGAVDTSTGTFKSTSISPAVTLAPGVYYLAVTSNDTTVQLRRISGDSNVQNSLNNNTVKKAGTATNSSTSGVLPSSLGSPAIGTAASVNFPVVTFER